MLGQLHARKVTALLAAAALAGCSQPAPSHSAPRANSSAPAPSATSTSAPLPVPSPLPDCLAAPPLPPPPAGVRTSAPAWVLAAGLAQPDDLWFRAGATYVGEISSGRVVTVRPGLPPETSTWVVPRAEGIAFVGDIMYVADQANDRVDVILAGQPQTFLQLRPVPGKDNIDGIAAQGDQLLVPDSPNGELLWVDPGGRVTRTVGGFNRPTGAWPLPGGAVLVADEYGNAVVRVDPDGRRTFLVSGLPIVDDVAADPAGHVFVVTPVISGGRLAELVDGRAIDLAGALLEPQGLGFDDAGNVLVAESAAGRIDVFVRSFKLLPAAGRPAPGQPVCLKLVRAPGFTGDVRLTGPSGVVVVRQPGGGDEGEVLVTLETCGKAGCPITAAAGNLADTVWIIPGT